MKTSQKSPKRRKKTPRCHHINPAEHRLVLKFLNDAVRIEDLMHGLPITVHTHPRETPVGRQDDHDGDSHGDHHKEKEIIKCEVAKKIIEFKNRKYPLGFRHWEELLEIRGFKAESLDDLVLTVGNTTLGEWTEFPLDIPQRGPGGITGVVHAALLKTGKVLFVTADETTLLWDPNNTAPSTFEDPVNQPHAMPGGYSQICGHHVHLSDPNGSLMSVGGGGYGPNPIAKAAYIFDPTTAQWRRSANDMINHKWYPTAVALGGQKILVASGQATSGDMELFDESSETFQPISGDDQSFPNLYPGLHLLPNRSIFYSRTGFGTAGAAPGGTSYDDDTINPSQYGGKRPAYFTFNDDMTVGTWQKITTSPINRTKGMSVYLNSSTPPHSRILVVGGADNATNDTYEIIDVSVLSAATAFDPWETVPDGQHRTLCSGVVLPTGDVFVCGGIQSTNSPCTMFDSQSNTWSPMANLPSVRDYHSVAILLPSGQVMMAGWQNTKIEIFSPPYLFKSPRPTIGSSPVVVHHGETFCIESRHADCICKVVFVRPMAVTHQTDSEQRVIELLPLIYNPASPTSITLKAPDGGAPHPMAPTGHYMMFAIDIHGVPSVAEWIYLAE